MTEQTKKDIEHYRTTKRLPLLWIPLEPKGDRAWLRDKELCESWVSRVIDIYKKTTTVVEREVIVNQAISSLEHLLKYETVNSYVVFFSRQIEMFRSLKAEKFEKAENFGYRWSSEGADALISIYEKAKCYLRTAETTKDIFVEVMSKDWSETQGKTINFSCSTVEAVIVLNVLQKTFPRLSQANIGISRKFKGSNGTYISSGNCSSSKNQSREIGSYRGFLEEIEEKLN